MVSTDLDAHARKLWCTHRNEIKGEALRVAQTAKNVVAQRLTKIARSVDAHGCASNASKENAKSGRA